ncbi:ABC transporter permease [Spartinivicinus poritis]|uniref:ABC transporter permease n=1 Tax=Spartinivicinus poritis TaxID=2994640 RepID=A0ABT5U9A2_9GAMM|nr:ABC transporter permease [Spartinivicinus sp. A2-2]MDE1462939.1 ABC transporter permease [Spartinivicinus sp. A2-2]
MSTSTSAWQRFKNSDLLFYFKKDKVAIGAAIIFLVMVIAAVTAPLTAPFNPYDLASIDVMDSTLPPVWQGGEADERFLLGTDNQGRDMLSTILYGTRTSLIIGLFAVLLQSVLGIAIGLAAGYYGGRVESFLMRLADVQLSFSTLMVAIVVSTFFQAKLGTEVFHEVAIYLLVIIIGFSEWPQFARTIRASVLAEKEKEYVQAAQVMGFGGLRIMIRHILPNCLPPIFVIATVQVANAIMSEAALSFLGLGMPETTPSLGSLIRSGFEYLLSGSWWITVIPGLVLVVLVLAINLLGDWLRDVLNPKLYKEI